MKPVALYSDQPARGWLPWGLLAPFLCLALVVATSLAGDAVLEPYGLVDANGDPLGITGLIDFLLVPFAFTGVAFLAWVWLVERRPLATIGLVRAGAGRSYLRGGLIGLGAIGAVVAGIWAMGGYTSGAVAPLFAAPRDLANVAILLPCFMLQSGVEELIFRGWLLSAVARKLGVVIAVILTGAVFSLLHFEVGQPWLVTLNIFLFSTFACIWAIRAGSIWGVMAWHATWNWLLGVGFEVPVTGLNTATPALLIQLVPHGAASVTGAGQGPEGSLACTAVLAAGIAWNLLRPRRGQG